MHEQLSQSPNGPLQPGTRAPAFSLRDTPDQTVSLSDLRGRIVILVFYPADWSPVCGSELALFNELIPEFQRFGATLLGVSVDGAWCHIARVRADFMGGVRAGVNGTPTFFINERRFHGPYDLDSLLEAVEVQIAAANGTD